MVTFSILISFSLFSNFLLPSPIPPSLSLSHSLTLRLLSVSLYMCMKLRAAAAGASERERETQMGEWDRFKGREREESRWLEPVASSQRNRCGSCDRRLPGRCDCSWRANERSKGPQHEQVHRERECAGLTVICGTETGKDQEHTHMSPYTLWNWFACYSYCAFRGKLKPVHYWA